MTPTAPQDINNINTMFQTIQPLMDKIYFWLVAEEDVKQYADVIQTEIDKCGFDNFKVISMKKKPFGFTFKIDETEATYQLSITDTQYKWKRTK